MRDQRGFSIVELLVASSAALIVMSALVMMIGTTLRSQDRITRRVDANQRARPVMTALVQDLHSSCVAPRVTPILAGSTGTSIMFLSKRSSAVSPTPELHTVSLGGTTLREKIQTPTSWSAPGPAPSWNAPFTDRILLTNISAPGGVIFRYYSFENGALKTTPNATPLSGTNAALTSQVSISFASNPGNATGVNGVSAIDPNSPLLVTDSVDMRLEAAGQYPNQDNLPCV
jgi:type II secretory pathway pseudopilin PulG